VAATGSLEARVLDALDERALVALLEELVAVPSVGGSPAEVEIQHLVARKLEQLDCDVDRWPIDLADAASVADAPGQEVERDEAWGVVGTLPGAQEAGPAVVLCGHTDVVPAGDRSLWPHDPFRPCRSGGTVSGRGTCDMKAGVAAALGALAAVRSAGIRLQRPVAMHAVVGEEDGGLGAWATLRRGHTGDACVITEPTAGSIVTRNAGALTFRLEVPGRAAHGAMRDQGRSAVERFAELHTELRVLEAERQVDADPELFGTRYPFGLSIGRVEAGDWASSVPDNLVAEGRYGVRLDESVEAARTAFHDRVAAFSARHPDLPPVRVSWVGGSFASGRLPAGHDLLGRTRAAVADAGGGILPERALAAGSDLRLYAAAGIPTVLYGPGDLRLAHGPGEAVAVADLVTAARALALLVVRTAGGR
jgi:acetylornithine deacetylase